MTLIKFEPIRELATIEERIQKYFDEFSNFGINHSDNFYPRIDISEDNENIHLLAEVPGVKKENIKITLQDNILTIEGEKKKETDEKGKNFFRAERMYGSFKRSFTLPSEADSNKVNAKFENGILAVEIKKLEKRAKSEKVIELK